jgi:hypothetical protein
MGNELDVRRPPPKEIMFTDDVIADALTQGRGLIGPAARALGCHRDTIRRALKRNPALQQHRKNCLGTLADVAVANIGAAVDAGDQKATYLVADHLAGEEQGLQPKRSAVELSGEVALKVEASRAREELDALDYDDLVRSIAADEAALAFARGRIATLKAKRAELMKG